MADMDALFRAVDELSPDEFRQVYDYVRQRQQDRSHQPSNGDAESRLARIHAAIDKFREGLTDDQLKLLTEAMNVGYSFPMKDLSLFDWADELPEDQI
jgi:predicted DNA binding protein